jgi:hypothetical protein
MKFLGFYPETVAARVRASAAPPRFLTLGQSIGFGAGGFCLVMVVIVLATAAVADSFLKKYLGGKWIYGFDALLFILLGGGIFRRLIIAPPVLRVYILFAAGFFLYETAWVAANRPFRNVLGEWLGSLAGATGLALALATVFDAPNQTVKVILVVCVTSAAGYFGGKFLQPYIPGIVGGLVWGAAYGTGLGTGLGYALYACQEPARQRLKTLSASGAKASASRPVS